MLAQRFLNLQCGYLVSARLEDVNASAAKNAIDTVFDDRSVASAKPAIAEGIVCGLGLAPIFREHTRTADFDLAGGSRRHGLAVLCDKLHLDARQCHANLCHTVALQQRVAADFLPALERAHRQRRRA